MQRRYFEHLYEEIRVAVKRRISRYDLWLLVWDGGGDPDELTQPQARYFVENNLSVFLLEEGLSLSDRARRQLEKRILRFDHRHLTPAQRLVSTFLPAKKAA